ncbi:MAG TPA: helix-turn-helix domain-containing protein, partial [Kofleriaceae bacterium]|nr:helix-turn-helix domain-containing protein [Kofleriaceae bacterium]
AYSWPGNVRELVNVIERAVSFCSHQVIELSDLPDFARHSRPATGAQQTVRRMPTGPAVSLQPTPPPTPDELLGAGVTFKDAKERWVATFERDYIVQTLKRNSGNISHAARAADIDRKYFRKLMKKYDIEAAGVDDDDEPGA